MNALVSSLSSSRCGAPSLAVLSRSRCPGLTVRATADDEIPKPAAPVSIPLSARQMRERAAAAGTASSTAAPSNAVAPQWTTAAPSTTQGAKTAVKRRKLQLTGEAGKDLALSLAMVADDLKGQDIMILDVDNVVSWTSYFVICTAINRPQMQAMMFRMEKEARDKFSLQLNQNPTGRSQWECMDFGQVVVHILTPENRQFYDLESFYTQAEEVYLEDHIVLV